MKPHVALAGVLAAILIAPATARDGSTAPTLNSTGCISGAVSDNDCCPFVNVVALGADPTGVSDSSASFTAALAAIPNGGIVYAPAGTYKLASAITATADGQQIMGAGRGSTVLVSSSTAPGMIVGAAGKIGNFTVTNLTLTRSSALNGSTIGIDAREASILSIVNVRVDNQDAGIRTNSTNITPNTALGVNLDRLLVSNCVVKIWLKDIAEVRITNCNFSLNGGETVVPTAFLRIEGNTNDVRVDRTQFIGQIANSASAVEFKNIPAGSPCFFTFDDINVENLARLFKADSTVLSLHQISVSNSRLTLDDKFLDFTGIGASIDNVSFYHNRAISFGTATTLTNFNTALFFGNCVVTGVLTFDGGGWDIVSNKLTNGATLTNVEGTFLSNVSNGTLTISGGTVLSLGNISTAGPIVQVSWIAPTLLNSWVNFGSGYATAGYRKDATGRIWLHGMIKNGTATYPTNFFVLPTGYRPASKQIFSVVSNDAAASVSVDAGGNVTVTSNISSAYVDLDGISFTTD